MVAGDSHVIVLVRRRGRFVNLIKKYFPFLSQMVFLCCDVIRVNNKITIKFLNNKSGYYV